MKNRITNLCALIAIYLLSVHQMEHTVAIVAENFDSPRNRGALKYNSRLTHFRRVKPETFANDFGDDDDIFDLSKRQQGNSDDYGHLRFGKRDEQFEDYGHMRFGRNGGEQK